MKAMILSSGGIDSTTCISLAVEKYGKENVSSVSIYYGQKLSKELECANKIAKHYDIKHYTFDLSQVYKYSNCSLLQHGESVVHDTYKQQLQQKERITSYVPFRNGLMLSFLATLASSLYENEDVEIYLGSHKDDYAYPDCSSDFIKKISDAINEGTYKKIKVVTPLIDLTKEQVIKKGLELKTPYDITWSCYEGGDKPCLKCASCLDRMRAFQLNNVKDPIL